MLINDFLVNKTYFAYFPNDNHGINVALLNNLLTKKELYHIDHSSFLFHLKSLKNLTYKAIYFPDSPFANPLAKILKILQA